MGIFDFLKAKKNPLEDKMEKMLNSIFPKGEKVIDAGAKELLFILNNRVDYDTAKNIFVKSSIISRISEKFDKERLRLHLSGYCLQHFNDAQIDKFYSYLVSLASAMLLSRITPSEVKRGGDSYYW